MARKAPFLVVLGVTGLALGGANAPGQVIEFDPEIGTTIQKAYEAIAELAVDEVTGTLGGDPLDTSLVDTQRSVSAAIRLRAVDQYVDVQNGATVELRRTYGTIAGEKSETSYDEAGVPTTTEVTGASALQSRVVRFTSNPAGNGYDVEFDDGLPDDPDLLDGLEEDIDFPSILPSSPVEVGAVWQLDPAKLKGLFSAAGDLKIAVVSPPPVGEDDVVVMPDFPMGLSTVLGDFTGTASARYLGRLTKEDKTVAVVSMRLDVISDLDVTEAIDVVGLPAEYSGYTFDYSNVTIRLEFHGAGVLHWDTAKKHVDFLSVMTSIDSVMEMDYTLAIGGTSLDYHIEVASTGSFTSNLTVSEP